MKRAKLFTALLSLTLLASCAERREGEVTESVTVSITAETSSAAVTEETKKNILGDYTETSAETSSAETSAAETFTEEITEAVLNDYSVTISGKNYSFYGGSLVLDGFDGDVPECAEEIKALDPKQIYVRAANPNESDRAAFMSEFPECEIIYEFRGGGEPELEGFLFSANPIVRYPVPDGEEAPTWFRMSRVGLYFSNFSDETVTVKTLRLYKGGGEWEPVRFGDGSYELALDYELEPQHNASPYLSISNDSGEAISDMLIKNFHGYDLALSDSAFDYNEGRDAVHYKAVVTADNGSEREALFFMDTENYREYLTPEQLEVFDRAIELDNEFFTCSNHLPEGFDKETKTFDDFYNEYLSAMTYDCAFRKAVRNYYINEDGSWLENIGGDRGSNITFWGDIYDMMTSGDNRVTIRQTNVFYHEDYPFSVSWDERNFLLVRTPDGWKVSISQCAW